MNTTEKKVFEEPKAEVIILEGEDIITESLTEDNDENGGNWV